MTQKKHEESIISFKKALPEYKKAKAWEKVASCYNKISENQWRSHKIEKSLQNAKKALEISDKYLIQENQEKANAFDNMANYYENIPDYDQALVLYKKALKIRQKLFSEIHLDIAKSYNNIGVFHYQTGDYTKSIHDYEKALAINVKILGLNHPKTGDMYNNIGAAYTQLGRSQKAIEYYKKNLTIKTKTLGKDHLYVGYTYGNLAATYRSLNNISNAIDYGQKALLIFIKHNHLQNLVLVYRGLGSSYSANGEYYKALTYFKKSLHIEHQLYGENSLHAGDTYQNVGSMFFGMGSNEKALDYYKRALQTYEASLTKNHRKVGGMYVNIGNVYVRKKKYEIALKYYKDALKIFNTIVEQDKTFIASVYSDVGAVSLEKMEYKDALKYYQKALQILCIEYGKEHILTGAFYNDIATVYHKQQKYDMAISFFDKAFIANSRNNTSSNVNPFNVNEYQDVHLFLQTLEGKAKTLLSKFKDNNNKQDLTKSIAIYKQADLVINTIRQSYQNYQDKVSFAKQAKEIYTDAINTLLIEYKETKEESLLARVFYYLERNKSNILKELLNDSHAKNYTGLPDELLTTEKIIRTNRAFYISQILKEESKKSIDTLKIKEYENELFNINRRRDSLNQSLEKNYPKYFKLKYNNDIVKTSDIQKQLDDKTTLLEFFTGDSITYAFTISKNEIAVQELATPKLTKQVEQFRESITSKNIQEFKKQSHLLYNALVTPIKEQLKGDKLIIVPDGSLWHLNFELLLTQNDVSENPGELSYLLKDYAINYANSANLLFNPFKKVTSKDKKEGCLAFSFSDSTNIVNSKNMSLATLRDAADDLPGTRKEIRAIADIIDGQYYFGTAANEANFKKKANQYKIVHLALHGEVDNERPENSKLFFTKSKDTIEDNLLYAHELFALDIPSELTVLSACNTGTGKIAKGEGIMSLGNAFQYAGTKSLLLSSWEVPDNTAPELMQYFYTNLKAGMNKGRALQQAKLQYLKTADRYRKAPFYWGGFYLVGDSAPIQFSTINYWYWILGFGALGILLLGLFLYKRKRR
ncbi:CHAT domain-containing tetratricopeptide repeat protein [Aquimarina sp. BL5]|uniref:CHAT domain-containing protein n=1 Tax=Aquimarina sp. BL5 TaxID=1714860 RepID=UPI0013145108|nr:CHAT domain-containing tetratricopeptide repeat protein [Aquimarina sp. BL5]